MIKSFALTRLAETILDPVEIKVDEGRWLRTVDRLAFVFVQLDHMVVSTAKVSRLEGIAAAALKPIRSDLGETEFAAMVERTRQCFENFTACDRPVTNEDGAASDAGP